MASGVEAIQTYIFDPDTAQTRTTSGSIRTEQSETLAHLSRHNCKFFQAASYCLLLTKTRGGSFFRSWVWTHIPSGTACRLVQAAEWTFVLLGCHSLRRQTDSHSVMMRTYGKPVCGFLLSPVSSAAVHVCKWSDSRAFRRHKYHSSFFLTHLSVCFDLPAGLWGWRQQVKLLFCCVTAVIWSTRNVPHSSLAILWYIIKRSFKITMNIELFIVQKCAYVLEYSNFENLLRNWTFYY